LRASSAEAAETLRSIMRDPSNTIGARGSAATQILTRTLPDPVPELTKADTDWLHFTTEREGRVLLAIMERAKRRQLEEEGADDDAFAVATIPPPADAVVPEPEPEQPPALDSDEEVFE
jgi:hypothetical protein